MLLYNKKYNILILSPQDEAEFIIERFKKSNNVDSNGP